MWLKNGERRCENINTESFWHAHAIREEKVNKYRSRNQKKALDVIKGTSAFLILFKFSFKMFKKF